MESGGVVEVYSVLLPEREGWFEGQTEQVSFMILFAAPREGGTYGTVRWCMPWLRLLESACLD